MTCSTIYAWFEHIKSFECKVIKDVKLFKIWNWSVLTLTTLKNKIFWKFKKNWFRTAQNHIFKYIKRSLKIVEYITKYSLQNFHKVLIYNVLTEVLLSSENRVLTFRNRNLRFSKTVKKSAGDSKKNWKNWKLYNL